MGAGQADLEFSNCSIIPSSRKEGDWNEISLDVDREYRLYLGQVTKTFQPLTEYEWLTEWYINAPNCSSLLTDILHYNREEKAWIEIIGKEGIGRSFDHVSYPVVSNKCATVETDRVRCLIHSVDDDYGPKWTKKLGIEYRHAWTVPEENDRVAIAEILSFLFGRKLINIGYTKFLKEGIPIEERYISPDYRNKSEICNAATLRPAYFRITENWTVFQEFLNNCIPKYLELRDVLNFKDYFLCYWLGYELPLGVCLPIMGAGLEMLADSWFKSDKSKSKGEYLSEFNFHELLKEEMTTISSKLQEYTNGNKIIRQIQKSFYMTTQDKVSTFLEEIGLPIGKTELQALRARNVAAHRLMDYSTEDKVRETDKVTFTYHTLLNRVILKLIGFSGEYIDYSTYGYPIRPLDEPAGGN